MVIGLVMTAVAAIRRVAARSACSVPGGGLPHPPQGFFIAGWCQLSTILYRGLVSTSAEAWLWHSFSPVADSRAGDRRHIRRSSYLCWFGNLVPARSVAGCERLGCPGDGRLIQGGVVIVLISDAGDRLAARSDVNVALGELLAGRQGVRRIALAGRKVA